MSAQYIYHEVNILLTYTLTLSFQSLLLDSRLMTLCYVICDMSFHCSRKKGKQKKKKRNIKSRKIDKKERKKYSSPSIL